MISLPDPELQVSFSAALFEMRTRFLQDALKEAVKTVAVPEMDKQLAEFVPSHSLSTLAAHGLRGELMFPIPIVLTAQPRLLGYYRLLYGYSQKEFYTAATGLIRFKAMEESGVTRAKAAADLPSLCTALCEACALLLAGIGAHKVSASLLHDLTLLTLGPQLRGGANVRKGTAGIQTVFNAIHEIVQPSVVRSDGVRIELTNAAGRSVLIEFAPDPDIIIRVEMRANTYRELVAIEVKAGSDFSNIHNRIGEAEKSHQKARASGYVECWTVVNVDKIDIDMARRESPSTDRFYKISDLIRATGPEYQDFRDRIISLTSIAA
jgi:hypothetical protein